MKKIVCFVVYFASFVILSAMPQKKSDTLSENFNQMGVINKECSESENTPSADMIAIGNNTMPSTQEGKCFLACFGERMGFLENGTFAGDKIETLARSMMAKEKGKLDIALKQIESCQKDFAGANNDKCQAGVILFACIQRLGKEMRVIEGRTAT